MGQAQQKPDNFEYARQVCDFLPTASYTGALNVYNTVLNDPYLDDFVIAEMGKYDRFFLLSNLLRRPDLYHPWLYERTREVEANPDDHLDLWARNHYKSTIITFAGSIQEIIKDPNITIGIFSHVRPIAKAFLSQVKDECELNPNLYRYYPDVFWEDPQKESSCWSLDTGLVFKRSENPKEKTIEAWGLVKGQPTSKHFRLIVYDDVVSRESVTNADQIHATTKAWELSRNLSSKSPDGSTRTWYIGTRYDLADTYRVMLERKVATPRVHPATDNGLPDGNPVFLTVEEWETKKRETPGHTLACQQLQNPIAGNEAEFQEDWIRTYEVRPEVLNVGILVDPAGSKEKGTSNSAFAVIGMDYARNKYLLDGACHKMNLTEKWTMLKGLRKKWINQPGVQTVKVGYEKYAHQSDIEHYETMMKIENYHFPIEVVNWVRDGDQAKNARIRRLIPDHQNWRFFYPYSGDNETRAQREARERGKAFLLAKKIRRKDHNNRVYDLVEYLLTNEYLFFPATTVKDLLDAMSRFYDLGINPPAIVNERDCMPQFTAGDL